MSIHKGQRSATDKFKPTCPFVSLSPQGVLDLLLSTFMIFKANSTKNQYTNILNALSMM